MTTIYFVRHGEYVNPNNIVPWRRPHFPLSGQGKRNINRDADFFKNIKIAVIYSSPILRAKQSAEILAKRLNKKIIISKLISEVRTPLQDKNLSYEEFNRQKIYFFQSEFHIKNNGESVDEIFNRVNKLVNKTIRDYHNRNVIFVSHGDPITIFIKRKKGLKVTGRREDFYNNYIPKAGIIKYIATD